ncbi:H-NS histone family protein [Duganella sp. sic0402]|nr:H-NS histone family protein [Duganella sp. sic0402]
MQDYKQINIEISNREKEIERLKSECENLAAERKKISDAELAEAVEKVNSLGGYATMEPPKSKASPRSASVGPKKYRNPDDGKEWSGQGYTPEWILNGDKEKFINPAWTAHQVAKKQSKKSETQNQSQTKVANKPLDIPTAETSAQLVDPDEVMAQAGQLNAVAVIESSAMQNGGADHANVATENISVVSAS